MSLREAEPSGEASASEDTTWTATAPLTAPERKRPHCRGKSAVTAEAPICIQAPSARVTAG
eukprot:4629340-Pyramimonas_sp.AAC.1